MLVVADLWLYSAQKRSPGIPISFTFTIFRHSSIIHDVPGLQILYALLSNESRENVVTGCGTIRNGLKNFLKIIACWQS